MRRVSPAQALTLFLLTGLVLLTLLFKGQIPLWRSLVFRYAILIGLLFVLRLSSGRSLVGKASAFFNTFSPILFVVLIYESLGDLIQYLQPDIDRRIDLYSDVRLLHFIRQLHPLSCYRTPVYIEPPLLRPVGGEFYHRLCQRYIECLGA